jgi:hypothetical protein
MSNGEMLTELQLMLQQEKITAKAAQRMILSAVAMLLKDTGELTERTNLMDDRIVGLRDANERLLVVVERHGKIFESWGLNPGRNFIDWCGKHTRFTLIILTMIVIIIAVDVIQGGYWEKIMINVDGWLKYLRLVL